MVYVGDLSGRVSGNNVMAAVASGGRGLMMVHPKTMAPLDWGRATIQTGGLSFMASPNRGSEVGSQPNMAMGGGEVDAR